MPGDPAESKGNVLTQIIAQKNALVSALGKHEMLGEGFSRSFNTAKKTFDIAPSDMPWMCQIKSLVNAVNSIEYNQNMMTGINKFLNNEKGTVSMLATAGWNHSALDNAKHNIEAFQYYMKQSGDDVLKMIPHIQAIANDANIMAANFNPIKEIIMPAAGSILQGNVYPGEMMNAIQQKILSQDFTNSPEQKNQTRSDFVQLLHFMETTKVNYGLKSFGEEEKIKSIAEPLFGNEYKVWQLASNQVHMEQKTTEMIKLQMMKNMITNETLKNDTPITALYDLREELKNVKSFEVKLFQDQIDHNIEQRTNIAGLDKQIKKLEGKLTLAIDDKNEPRAEIKEAELSKAYAMREELLGRLQDVKDKKTSTIFHYDPKQNSIVQGELSLNSSKPICNKDSKISKDALAALDRNMENNLNQKTVIHNNITELKQQIGPAQPSPEQLEGIKQIIHDGEKQKLNETMKKSEIRDQIKDFMEEKAPKKSIRENLELVTIKPVADAIKGQIKSIADNLNDECKYRIYNSPANSLSDLKENYDNDKPIVQIIKSSVNALDLMEKNLHNMQVLRSASQVSTSSLTKALWNIDTVSDARALRAEISNIGTNLTQLKTDITQHASSQILASPVFQQIAGIADQVKTIYSQMDPKQALHSVAENTKLKILGDDLQQLSANDPRAKTVDLAQDIGQLAILLKQASSDSNVANVSQAVVKTLSVMEKIPTSAADAKALTEQMTEVSKTLAQEVENQIRAVAKPLIEASTQIMQQSIPAMIKEGREAIQHDVGLLNEMKAEIGISIPGKDDIAPDLHDDLSLPISNSREPLHNQMVDEAHHIQDAAAPQASEKEEKAPDLKEDIQLPIANSREKLHDSVVGIAKLQPARIAEAVDPKHAQSLEHAEPAPSASMQLR